MTEHLSFSPEHPLTLETFRGRMVVTAHFDVDGTANNEEVPEKERLTTIGPAKQAIAALQEHGIFAGPCSARGTGELEVYAEALGARGGIIGEDGTVIILPTNSTISQSDLTNDLAHMKIIESEARRAILLSRIDVEKLKEFTKFVLQIYRVSNPNAPIYSSLTSSVKELMASTGNESADFIKRSIDRLGSGYFDKIPQDFFDLLNLHAPSWGIRVVGNTESASIFGADANKGTGIAIYNQLASHLYPGLDGVVGSIPIVFGNGPNDIPLLIEAKELGGLGVIVGKPNGGYFVPETQIPNGIYKAQSPFGYGMLEAVPHVFEWLEKQRQV